MPTLTIKIAVAGTPLANGKSSQVGHMWYSLTDDQGIPHSGESSSTSSRRCFSTRTRA